MAGGGESGSGSPRASGQVWDVRRVEETGSTNADVAALARAGAPAGVVLVADYQHAGRGRRGRSWTAPPGAALLASVLLRPRLAPSAAPLVGLAAGLAAVEACAEVAGVVLSLKWPNDVVVEAAEGATKVAGLLAESVLAADRLAAVVVGMGCNLRSRPGPASPRGARYLEDLAGRPVGREELLHAWLSHIGSWCTTLEAPGGSGALLDAYRRGCGTLGRLVRVELATGSVDGRAVDVVGPGNLVIESDGGRQEVAAGEVIHLRAPS